MNLITKNSDFLVKHRFYRGIIAIVKLIVCLMIAFSNDLKALTIPQEVSPSDMEKLPFQFGVNFTNEDSTVICDLKIELKPNGRLISRTELAVYDKAGNELVGGQLALLPKQKEGTLQYRIRISQDLILTSRINVVLLPRPSVGPKHPALEMFTVRLDKFYLQAAK